jgi:hypothetical protein
MSRQEKTYWLLIAAFMVVLTVTAIIKVERPGSIAAAHAEEPARLPIDVYEPPQEFTLVGAPKHVVGTEYGVRIRRADGTEFTGVTNQPERLKVGEVVQVTAFEYAHSTTKLNLVYFVRPK